MSSSLCHRPSPALRRQPAFPALRVLPDRRRLLRRRSVVPPPPRTTAPPRHEAPPTSDYLSRQHGPPTIGGILPRQEEPCPGDSPIFDWSLNATTEFSPIRSPIFDWNLNATIEDPMASGYEPYIDMLTQDADADLQLVMQSTSSNGKGTSRRGSNFSQSEDADADLQLLMQPTSSNGKGTSRRGSNFSQSEDIQLCISWMNVGNDQLRTAFWQRITNDFHQNKDLEHRCTTILKDCMQFHGYYEDIQCRRPSGVPHQEHHKLDMLVQTKESLSNLFTAGSRLDMRRSLQTFKIK